MLFIINLPNLKCPRQELEVHRKDDDDDGRDPSYPAWGNRSKTKDLVYGMLVESSFSLYRLSSERLKKKLKGRTVKTSLIYYCFPYISGAQISDFCVYPK